MFGVLPAIKPQGLTSRDVVNHVAKIIRPVRVGHTGTLDPMATGVLLLAVGYATRLMEFSHLESKEYVADFWLGKSSDTLDAEGVVTSLDSPARISQLQLSAELPGWTGDIQQTPPRYSAVHVDGKRAYELARRGKEFSLPPRTVHIDELQLTHCDGEQFGLRIVCGTGTYIRSLGSDIAQALGSDAVMFQLTRTRIGAIGVEQCIALEQLTDRGAIARSLLPPQSMLTALEKVVLDEHQCARIRNGIPIELEGKGTGPILAVDERQEIVAILAQSGRRYRSLRVFHTTHDTVQPTKSSSPQSPES